MDSIKPEDKILVSCKIKGGHRGIDLLRERSYFDPTIKPLILKKLKKKICIKCNKVNPLNAIICRSKKCGNGKTLRLRKPFSNGWPNEDNYYK